MVSVGGDVKKLGTSCSVGGSMKCTAAMENSMAGPQKLKRELPYKPAIPFLGVYPTEMETGF